MKFTEHQKNHPRFEISVKHIEITYKNRYEFSSLTQVKFKWTWPNFTKVSVLSSEF